MGCGTGIEEIVDDEKPDEKAAPQQSKKKNKQASNDDRAQKQVVLKSSGSVPVLENEDEDDFPISSADNDKASVVSGKQRSEESTGMGVSKRDATISMRDKLESLCRELQRQNKMLMDECKRVSTESQNLRLELSNKFQEAIKDVTNKLEEQRDDSLTQLKENEMLRNQLKQKEDQIALSEQQYAHQLKQKSLELQIADLKIQQHKEKFVKEQSQMKMYAEQVSSLPATEKNLRLQLTADSEKFQQFQDALVKSNEVFETFKQEIESKTFDCPDPEFSDFEKDRNEKSFASKQIWACYDTLDAMPRFYAYIKKVLSPGFKLQIQWLKPDPGTTDEKKWVQKDLPVSCGGYKRDKPDKAEDLLSFSHLVSWEAGQKAGTFIIIPRKRETWAIFRNWSMNWHSSIEVDEDVEDKSYEELGCEGSIVYQKFVKKEGSCCGSPRSVLKGGSWKVKEF